MKRVRFIEPQSRQGTLFNPYVRKWPLMGTVILGTLLQNRSHDVVVYNENTKRKPSKLADFFNTRRFRGKRVLLKQPKYTLEMALLADGVAASDIYTTLATPEGENRAFEKLTHIKDHIVWAEKPGDVFQQVAQKGVSMGLAFNGRAFMAIVSERKPLGILWDRQIYSFDYWAIPADAKNAAAARAFFHAVSPMPATSTETRPDGAARSNFQLRPSTHLAFSARTSASEPEPKRRMRAEARAA